MILLKVGGNVIITGPVVEPAHPESRNRTGTGQKPEKNRLSKNTLNIHIFNKYIYIHVHPCQFKQLYTNMQSFSCI